MNEKINLNFLNDNNSSDEIMESLVNSLSISPQKQSLKESKRQDGYNGNIINMPINDSFNDISPQKESQKENKRINENTNNIINIPSNDSFNDISPIESNNSKNENNNNINNISK